MKTMLTTMAVAALFVRLAAWGGESTEELVPSSNIHAMVRVISAATNTIVAVPWMGYTPDNAATTNLMVNRLVRPTNLTLGDHVLMHTNDNTSAYAAWELVRTDEKCGTGTADIDYCWKWEPVMTVTRREIDRNGTSRSDVSNPKDWTDELMREKRGYGIWLVRQRPVDANNDPVPFYLYGQWVSGGTNVTIRGGTVETPACTLLANPNCLTETVINKLPWTGTCAPGPNDTLILTTDRKATRYCTFKNGTWRYSHQYQDAHGMQQTTYETDLRIPAGTGFWYVRRSTGNLELIWR